MISAPIRIAMWSGPRNISTAIMRAWGNRPDTSVIDEPLYAYYLERTGKDHPIAAEVIAAGETDWHKVARRLTEEPVPGGKAILFQKQMTHHLLPEIDHAWILNLMNCFLIRDPREVMLSYIKKSPNPALEDLGFVQQCEIFEFVRTNRALDREIGSIPPVIDARDVLENPERTLRLLCETIGVPFDEAMLSWPPGLRETDGIWAKHWYDAVVKSTSFEPHKLREGNIPDSLREIYERCNECYTTLYQHRLR
ncbi:MAG TPA: hypothetical protein VLK27_10610 [Chthoniobacterales bacterium]|nr:hypothetical protein [Chthoniobacterales bacterium]